jgi:predicted  nucleic acid-binding Zn-ribbon protein
MKTKIEESVTGKENESKSMDGEIKSRAESIQKLTEEINQLQDRKTKLANEASENHIKIERVRNNFAATLQIFVGKIKSDLEKITKYIA